MLMGVDERQLGHGSAPGPFPNMALIRGSVQLPPATATR
jgi:hypothetical protein